MISYASWFRARLEVRLALLSVCLQSFQVQLKEALFKKCFSKQQFRRAPAERLRQGPQTFNFMENDVQFFNVNHSTSEADKQKWQWATKGMFGKKGKHKSEENNRNLIFTSVGRTNRMVKQTAKWVYQHNTKLQKRLWITHWTWSWRHLFSQRDAIV